MEAFKKFLSRPELVFIVLASLFGLASIFIMPMQMIPDEQAHFARAYSLSEGKIFPDGEVDGISVYNISAYNLPRQVAEYNDRIWQTMFTRHTDDDIFSDKFDPTVFTEKIDFSDRKLSKIWGTESYAPIAHLPQAIGVSVGRLIYPSIGIMYTFGRLFNLAFYVLAVYFIIKKVKRAKWAYAVIALFPMIIAHAASFSADSIAAVGILGMFMVMHNLFVQKEKIKSGQVVWLIVFSVLAAFVRPTNLVLLLPIIILPVRLFITNPRRLKKVPFNLHKWMLIIGSMATVILLVLGWMRFYGATYNTTSQSGASSSSKITWIIENPIRYVGKVAHLYIDADVEHGSFTIGRYLYDSVGQFSWRFYNLPVVIFALEYIILLLAVLVTDGQKTKSSEAALSLLTYLAIILATPTAMFIMSNAPPETTDFGLQPRYFAPMFVALIPFGLWLQRWVSVKLKSEAVMGVMVGGVAFVSLTCYIIQTALTFI
jgi:uncharacterized membrane protein